MKMDIVDVLAVIALMAISGNMGWQLARAHFESAAVKSGHAEYVEGKYGQSVWRLKEVAR